MNLQAFIKKYDGKFVDKDGAAGNQCMDLANIYVCEEFGYPVDKRSPIGAAYAYKSFQNGHEDFVRIEGKDLSQFQEGDVIYWDLSLGNKAGHVAIFIKQEEHSFASFDQNYPEGSPCHVQAHSTASVCGVLRHKSMVKPTEPIEPINPKEHMQLFKQAQQMIWTKIDGVTEYWVIWLKDDGSETKRLVTTSKNRCQDIFSGAGKYCRWSTSEQFEILSRMPRGEDFDLNGMIDNHPELLEQ